MLPLHHLGHDYILFGVRSQEKNGENNKKDSIVPGRRGLVGSIKDNRGVIYRTILIDASLKSIISNIETLSN